MWRGRTWNHSKVILSVCRAGAPHLETGPPGDVCMRRRRDCKGFVPVLMDA